jgi:hypothetical protein
MCERGMPTHRPKLGTEVHELHDRLVVELPRPSRWTALVPLVWLGMLTWPAVSALNGVWEGEAAVAWYLPVYAVAGHLLLKSAARAIWQREDLVATADRVEVRRELDRFKRLTRTRGCPTRLVLDVRVAQGSDAETGEERCAVQIIHIGGKLSAGGSLSERDADYLAATVRRWLQQHAGWVRDDVAAAAATARTWSLARTALFPACVLVVLAGIVYTTFSGEGALSADGAHTFVVPQQEIPPPPPGTSRPNCSPQRPSPPCSAAARKAVDTLSALGVRELGKPTCGVASITTWWCAVPSRDRGEFPRRYW